MTAFHLVIITCTHVQTLNRCVEASEPRQLRLQGRRLQIMSACLQVNARAIFRVSSLIERMEQAKREEVRRKKEQSRSGRVVE